MAGISARVIAEAAGLSQGLIFYHYGSVTGLLAAAADEVTTERARVYRQRLSEVVDLGGLVAVARQLHDEERQLGNVAFVAQLLAGAHTHPELAPVARENFDLLAAEVRHVLDRLLGDNVLVTALPVDHLAHVVSAAFIGMELLPEGGQGDAMLFDTLEEIGRLVDNVLDLGPTATAVLRRHVVRGKGVP